MAPVQINNQIQRPLIMPGSTEQQQLAQLIILNAQRQGRPLTFEEFMMVNGYKQPGTQSQAPKAKLPDPGNIQKAAEKLGIIGGGGAEVASQLGGGAATTAAENAAFNAAAMEASGAPMTLAEPGLAAAAETPFFSWGAEGLLGEGAMPLGNYIPGVAGVIGGADLLMNDYGTGRNLIQGGLSGAGIGFTLGGPVGAGIGAGIGLGIGGAKSLFKHKTTKEYEKEVTDKLLKKSSDPSWQQAVQHFRSVEHPEGDKGEGWDPKAALERAKKDGKELWGTSAVLDAFGPDWFNKASENQREEVTRLMAQRGLFSNSKGDWHLTNPNEAQQIFNEVLSGQSAKTTPGTSEAGGTSTSQQNKPLDIQAQGIIERLGPNFKPWVQNERIPVDTTANAVTKLFKPGTMVSAPTAVMNMNTGQPMSVPGMPAPIMIPKRSRTSSPGIGLDGRRIQY